MKPTADITLVWFRRDLRLADNPALVAAAQQGKVVPVFIWDDSGPWALGGASRWWLHQSLTRLQEALEAKGSRLILRIGDPLQQLLSLAEETGAKKIVWNRRYDPVGIAADKAIKLALREAGLAAHSHCGNLLFEPWSIQNQSGLPYQVFTPFWKALQKRDVAEPVGAPKLHSVDKWPESLELNALRLEPSIDWAGGIREAWEPGEAGAHKRLKRFMKKAAQYAADRDRPDHEGTSRLSPHLALGEMTPRQIWHAVTEEPYRRQLAWREFGYHLLYHFPDTPEQPLRKEFARFPWEDDKGKFKRHLKAWTKGLTGFPIVDAGMRELWHTGWMHNRVRLIVGSFLVKDLLIPWQEGAHWFWDTLVDADLANNTLGWQWVSGCGADAAPYFRIFHPVLQAEKFDPDGAYVRRWVPEIGGLPNQWLHKPWEAPVDVSSRAGVRLGQNYPSPLVDHAEARTRALAALAKLKSKSK